MKKSKKKSPKTDDMSNVSEINESEKSKIEKIIDSNVESFIFENIRILDYRDIAKFTRIKPEALKSVLGELGIKVPIAGARKWDKIDVGKYCSITDCSQCQVQMNHRMFLVGSKNCHKCYEKNISFWVKEREKIMIIIPEKAY
ncbi:hypothetical protein ACFL6H_07575 [Candidatus Latescibacterota bacterium]